MLLLPAGSQLICRVSMEHPHHTLFIIFALVNANKDENFSRNCSARGAVRQQSPFDLVRFEKNDIKLLLMMTQMKDCIVVLS